MNARARLADIVRHFAITRHSDEKLRTMQQAVVDELLTMRPNDGFPNVDSARNGTLEACASCLLLCARVLVITPFSPAQTSPATCGGTSVAL